MNHSFFKRKCLLEDHRILVFRVGVAAKAEVSKTVGDIFVFILLNALQYMGMVEMCIRDSGDAADHDLLMEEGIGEADAVIALTGMDEENIIMSLFAKTQGVNKIVAKVNEDSRAQMVEGLGIDSIVSAKSATADAIMSYVRARNNSCLLYTSRCV